MTQNVLRDKWLGNYGESVEINMAQDVGFAPTWPHIANLNMSQKTALLIGGRSRAVWSLPDKALEVVLSEITDGVSRGAGQGVAFDSARFFWSGCRVLLNSDADKGAVGLGEKS